MNWKNIISKCIHGLAPATGAAAGAVAFLLISGAPITIPAIAATAGGAFLAYLAKKARPDVPAETPKP